MIRLFSGNLLPSKGRIFALEAQRRKKSCVLVSALSFVFLAAHAQDKSGMPTFLDVTVSAGVGFRHHSSKTSQKYLIETMGAGVALLDYDGDGFLDVFFVNGAALDDPMPIGKPPDKSQPKYWNRLYRNSGDGSFVDITEESGVRGNGYGMGVTVGDYDNDGNPDLYVTNFGSNLLYHNEGDGTFAELGEEAGVQAAGWSTGAAFLDYDRDGDLDLFVARYLNWNFQNNPWCGPAKSDQRGYCHPNAFESVTHLLFRNEGNGTFVEVSESAGIGKHPGKGLGVTVHDYNLDSWPDVFVANDSVAQQLFTNNGDGTFGECALPLGVAYNSNGRAFAGMGTDFDDYNNDGWPDLFVNALSLEGYVLFQNTRGHMEDRSAESGMSRISLRYSGWGSKFMDYDNDGWKDLFVAQGHVMDTITIDFPDIPYKQPFLMMKNERGRFRAVSNYSGPAFSVAHASRGAAFGDLDNDGFVDIVVNNNNELSSTLRNQGNQNNWILVNTVGSASNRDGVGAKVKIVTDPGGSTQYGLVSTASSYLSASDKRVHFGLGSDTQIKEMVIHWPSGVVQRLQNLNVNTVLTVEEPSDEVH